jgi:hypothetical protein
MNDNEKLWDDNVFSVRARHVLRELNIDTLDKLRGTNDSVLLRYPNVGRRTLAELRAYQNDRLFGVSEVVGMSFKEAFDTIEKQRDALIEQEKIIMKLKATIWQIKDQVKNIDV